MQTGVATVENSMEFPQETAFWKMELPFDPAIQGLRLHPKDTKAPIQKNLCTPMFMEALFTIAKYWKQPKCPSVNKWIKNWYIYTMEYYIAKSNKELLFLPFVTA